MKVKQIKKKIIKKKIQELQLNIKSFLINLFIKMSLSNSIKVYLYKLT
jgi:hypothetical protein